MKREKNLFFKELKLSSKSDFGGALLKNSHAKVQRPISTKRAMHVVLRSLMCKGELSMLSPKNAKKVEEIIWDQGEKLGVKIYRFANSGNHLHILVLPKTRKAFLKFIRAISGLISRAVLGVERGVGKGNKENKGSSERNGSKGSKESNGSHGCNESNEGDESNGRNGGQGKKFWDQRPYSCIVEWGKHFARVKKYIAKNILEAIGFVGLEISEGNNRVFS